MQCRSGPRSCIRGTDPHTKGNGASPAVKKGLDLIIDRLGQFRREIGFSGLGKPAAASHRHGKAVRGRDIQAVSGLGETDVQSSCQRLHFNAQDGIGQRETRSKRPRPPASMSSRTSLML